MPIKYVPLLLLLLAGSAQATVRYVNNTAACNGSGTLGSPYCAIQLAINAASAGDDIRVENAGSDYNEDAWSNGIQGALGNPITIEGADSSGNQITATGRADLGTLTYSSPPPRWYCASDGVLFTTGNYCINLSTTGIVGGASPYGGSGIGVPFTICQGAGTNCFNVQAFSSSYWVIKNIRFDATPIPSAHFAGKFALWIEGGNAGISIVNNTFSGIGGTIAQGPSVAPTAIDANGMADGGLISNNRFVNTRGDAISNNHVGYNTLTIQDNEFVGITPFFDSANCGTCYESGGIKLTDNSSTNGGAHGTVATTVTHNVFHDFSLAGAPVASNTETFPIWVDVGASAGVIDSNLVYNLTNSTGLFIEDNTQGWIVKNNIVHDEPNGVGISDCLRNGNGENNANVLTDNNYFYNNTCYNTGRGFESSGGNAIVENNIFNSIISQNVQITVTGTIPFTGTIDYNDHNTAGTVFNCTGHSGQTFAQWQSVCGFDAHGINADPLFVTTSGNNYMLQSSSPAIDAGTNTGVAVDYDGITRPQSVGFDMGAFEFWRAGSFGIR